MGKKGEYGDVSIVTFHSEGRDSYIQEENMIEKNIHRDDGHEDNGVTTIVEIEEIGEN